jgi:DNA gyrase/topoisomerase IV subunit B
MNLIKNKFYAITAGKKGVYWIENSIIYKVMTPLVVAKKGKRVMKFYSDSEFNKWYYGKLNSPTSWNIEYKKGLASLEDNEYEEIN